MFGHEVTSPGGGIRISVPARERLGFEGELSWFSIRKPSDEQAQGGRTFIAKGGITARAIDRTQFSLLGLMSAGLIQSNREFLSDTENWVVFVAPGRHLLLEFGLSGVFFPSSRISARVDATHEVYGALTPSGSNEGAVTANAYRISAGLEYRLSEQRPRRPVPSSPDDPRRFVLGPQLVYSQLAGEGMFTLMNNAGPGAFGEYRLSHHVDLDGMFTAFVQPQLMHTPWSGGRVLQTVGGIMWGGRGPRVGLFFRARGGVESYSQVFLGQDAGMSQYGRVTNPLLDLGGTVEYWRTKDWVMRVDAGVMRSVSRQRNVSLNGVVIPETRPPDATSVQFAFGVGRRL
ncbi:MAG: hypothetical protein LBQ09_11120 [Acidobacteriaceae bacterium]|nr:hypothetical protein [Acidobacteriaceae bacterium]